MAGIYSDCSTHTHPFNGPFSGTTQVSRYQKGITNLDFTEARDSEWQWHQLGHMQVCTSLQTDNHASTHHSVFYRPDALPATQPTASKHYSDCSTHTHTPPFNGPLSGTTQVSRYKKGKTNLDFTGAREMSGSGISWAICKSATRSRQITTPALHYSSFLQAGCPSCRPTNSVKALVK